MVLDLHIHTTKGGPDSELTPEVLAREARRRGLDGAVLMEHDVVWEKREVEKIREEYDFPFFRAMEVSTDYGHILCFGLERYIGGIHRLKDLRKAVDQAGGFLIVAHPFRRIFYPQSWAMDGKDPVPTVDEMTHAPVLEFVHTVEVLNGQCSPRENRFTLEVATKLNLVGTGGSDAHSTHGLGKYSTVFPNDPKTDEELLRDLREGHYYPAEGLLDGELARFSIDDATVEQEAATEA